MKSKGHTLAVFFLTIAVLAPLTHMHVFAGGNDASRFAQIESLVDYGHTYIDESISTVDSVMIDGKKYSNKPPVLSIIGAGIYYFIKKTTGLTFSNNEAAVVYLLTFFLVVIPTAWMVALFYFSLGYYDNVSFRVRCLTTLALATGTILTSYSVTLNNHTVAAAILFAAFQSAWRGNDVKAGVWSALTACIDIVPGLLFIPVFALLLYHRSGRNAIIRYSIPLIAGAAVFVAANLWIVNYFLPPKMVPGGIDNSSEFASSIAGVLLPDSWTYPLECLFGWHGFITVSPVLIYGILGLGMALKTGYPLPRRQCLLLTFTITVMIVGHTFFVGSYGGWSYGFRYLIPIIPIIMFFAPPVVEKHIITFNGLLSVSVLFALIGVYNPWPPGYQQELNKDPISSLATNPIGANATAWMQEYFPDSIITDRMKSLFVSPDERLQIRYLIMFYISKGDIEMAKNTADAWVIKHQRPLNKVKLP